MAKTAGANLAVAVAKAIGLDPSTTKWVAFSFKAGEVMHVEASLFLTEEQEVKLVNLVADYEFTLRED